MHFELNIKLQVTSLLFWICAMPFTSSLSAQSDFVPGYILTNDGDKMHVRIKKFTSDQAKILYKDFHTDKKSRIDSDDIKEMCLVMHRDSLFFYKENLVKYGPSYNRMIEYDGICWASKVYSSDKIEVYHYNWKETNIVWVPALPIFGAFNTKHLTYGLRFPGDDYIIDVSGHSGLIEEKKIRKKVLRIFSVRCQKFEALDKIEKKHHQTLQELIAFYEMVCG